MVHGYSTTFNRCLMVLYGYIMGYRNCPVVWHGFVCLMQEHRERHKQQSPGYATSVVAGDGRFLLAESVGFFVEIPIRWMGKMDGKLT